MGNTRSTGSSGRASAPSGAGSLPVLALVAAFLIGPLGIALAAWWLVRRPTDPRGRALAWAAIAVGALQTIVVTFLLLPGAPGRNPDAVKAPDPAASTWTYPTNPPPSAPITDPSVTLTPIPPTATSLEEFVPETVDSYDWVASGEDTEALDAGAEDAQQGTFTTDDDVVEAGMAEWATPEQAADQARARAEADFPDQEPLAEGDIRYGAGHFWYYEQDGVGTVYWYYGKFSAKFSGSPYEVQEFFLRFPK